MEEVTQLAHVNLNVYAYDRLPEEIQFKNIDIQSPDLLSQRPNRRRRSPIMVEFLDPQVKLVDIARVLEEGMNIIKYRLANTSKPDRINLLSRVDKAAERCAEKQGVPSCPIATSAALKTWVKRCGIFDNNINPVEIMKNSEVILTSDKTMIDKCTSSFIYVDFPELAKDVPVGMEISLGFDSENVVMRCIKIMNSKSIKCLVHKGGKVNSVCQAYFRNLKIAPKPLGKMDVEVINFIIQYHVDILIVFYTVNAEMIKKIRHLFGKAPIKPLIFGSICNQQGIDHLDDILKECDGIIMCRENLSLELDYPQVFRMTTIQKHIAGKCQLAGKPLFITAVLETIIEKGIILDSEIADVTNALMDGVTGFIINDCSDINNTLLAIKGLNAICCQVEPLTFSKNIFWRLLAEPTNPLNAAEAAVMSCMMIANQTNARIVILSTVTGRTARALLWLQPAAIVIAVCQRPTAARKLYTYRNVIPLMYKGPTNQHWHLVEDARVAFAAEFAIARQWLVYGDLYVALQRSFESHLYCDMVRVLKVETTKKHRVECHYSDEDEQKNLDKENDNTVQETSKRKKKKKKKKQQEPEHEPEEVKDEEG